MVLPMPLRYGQEQQRHGFIVKKSCNSKNVDNLMMKKKKNRTRGWKEKKTAGLLRVPREGHRR
jgi:hypothetical protein